MTTAPHVSSAQHFLVCVTGPDQGKRVALTATEMLVGRSAEANLLSDDPDVTDRFATLQLDGLRLRVHGLATLLPYADGHAAAELTLLPGQQLRMGRSLWEFRGPGASPSVMGFVNSLGDHLSSVAGIEKPGEWNPREMFADVRKKHTDEEIEAYFTVGTPATTPPLSAVDPHWPKPWVFFRVFGASVLLYLGFVWAWRVFLNDNLLPGLLVVGSVAIPFSLLIFFFEVNVPRNISLYQVIKLLLIGGLVSIAVSLVFFRVTDLSNWLGAASAGIIEESGKALTLLLVVRQARFRWTLNGLLLGATVGTGFAVFESAGYALTALAEGGAAPMRQLIMERGLLSVLGGHVLWTGLVGAALWRVRGDRPFSQEMLTDARFLRVLGVCMAMHMIWNSPWNPPAYAKFVLLGAAAWVLILGMIQSGLKEVRDAQGAVVAAPLGPPSASQ